MPYRPEKIRSRGYLPQWEAEGASYSVTFRLWDSLPAEVVERFERERREIVEIAEALERELTPQELERLDYLYSERIEGFLDSGAGACYLREEAVGNMVFEAVRFFHGKRYTLFTWCVMPNHVHVLFRPEAPHTLGEVLNSWKGFTSHEANKLLGRKGMFWMIESYTHMVRDEADFMHSHRYILENPGKAGLREWKWVGSYLKEGEGGGGGLR